MTLVLLSPARETGALGTGIRRSGLALACLLLVGCGRAEDQARAPGGVAWQPVGASVPLADQAELRHAGGAYEIEVQRKAGFPGGDFEPVLSIGEASFQRYRPSPSVGGHYGLIYAVSGSEFASLVDGSDIVVHYGPSKDAGWVLGEFRHDHVSH